MTPVITLPINSIKITELSPNYTRSQGTLLSTHCKSVIQSTAKRQLRTLILTKDNMTGWGEGRPTATSPLCALITASKEPKTSANV